MNEHDTHGDGLPCRECFMEGVDARIARGESAIPTAPFDASDEEVADWRACECINTMGLIIDEQKEHSVKSKD
jgi:hypothetical protein